MITKIDLITKVMTDIAPKYWDDGEYSAISKSRLGMFGVISETMGLIFENASINNAIKAREMLTTTASRYTLLKEAAMYPDLTIASAEPSTITLSLGIPIAYLKEKFMTDSSTIDFTLDSDTKITISDIPYLMDYDLKIIGKLIDGKWLYSAQYIITTENGLSTVTNPYLVTSIKTINSIQYIMVNITVRQLVKNYNYYNIVETEAISLNGIDFTYTENLAYFNVFYKTSTGTTYSLVNKINYLSNVVGSGTYVYYDISSTGKIRIYIPSDLNFEFNSMLRIDVYTTTGTSGNFNYTTGEVIVLPQSLNNQFDYTGFYYTTVVLSSKSAGGTDSVSTDALRTQIIEYKSTLKSIDTETDLNTYFKKYDTVNTMTFTRKRIDVLEKVYTAFMLMKDAAGNVMSTNSLDMHLTESDVAAHYTQTARRVIKPTKAYKLMSGQNYKVASHDISALTDAQINTLEESATDFLFGCPYLMVINENPQSVSFYLNSIDKTNSMNIAYYNENALLQFVINTINIKRNAVNGEDKYTLTFNLIPSSELPEGIVDSSGNIIDATIIKPYGYVYSADTTDTITSYFPISVVSYNKTNAYFSCQATLTTDEYISLDDRLRFTNSLYNQGESTTSDTVINITDVKLGVGVYYKSTTMTEKGTYTNIIPNMTNYGLVNVYTNEKDKATFMINMSKKIRTNISFINEGAGVISFDLTQIPLIRYTELKANISKVSSIIDNTNTIITSMLNLVKNNMSIDYKFYATYGKSRYFTLGNTSILLDKLNLSLKFKVRISSTKTDATIANDIKAFIQPLVESVNNTNSPNSSSVYFSNIITKIENEYKYSQDRIIACELTKINAYTEVYQSLINTTKALTNMTKAELLAYVPEFTKVPQNYITIELLQI